MYLDQMFGLKGKTIVVTGGGRGIGQVVAQGLANAGAEIVVLSRTGGKETVEKILADGNKAYDVIADITDELQVIAAFKEVINRSGKIDVVFNNAGITIHKTTFETSIEEWKEVIDINLMGAYIVSRVAAKLMIEKGIEGSIINNASISASIVNIPQMQTPYNVSKAGLIHLTKSLALEWADYQIRVNAISPGYIATPMSADAPKHLIDAWLPMIPYHRMGKPEELIGAVIYLASQASTYTTGSELIIDGGYTLI